MGRTTDGTKGEATGATTVRRGRAERRGAGGGSMAGLPLILLLLALGAGTLPARAQSGLPPADRPEPTKPQKADEGPQPPAGAVSERHDVVVEAARPALRAELVLERRLLAEDLLRYSDLRESERQRWRQVDDLKTEIDVAVAAEDLLRQTEALDRVRTTESRLESAVGEAENAAARARDMREQIVERVRKIQWLDTELGRLAPAQAALADPLTGRWEVTLKPDLATGVFDLVLDGTQVSGRYRMTDQRTGSLRGHFTGRELHLERIDREKGFDAVLEGSLDLEKERITGFWRPTDLSGGAPGGGDWWAEKAQDQQSIEAPAEEPAQTEEESP